MDLTLNVVERKTGGLSCGGGISSQGHSEGALPGFIGSASFSQRNLFGLNQKLAATVEIGQVLHLLQMLFMCCTQKSAQTALGSLAQFFVDKPTVCSASHRQEH